MTTSPASPLSIDSALKDGWAAFKRAPWTFVGFALVSGVLSQLAGLIPFDPFIIQIVVNLWATIGMIRGAWIALAGGRPTFDDFTRWDWSALGRLFVNQFVLGVLVFFVLLVAAGLAFTLVDGPSLAVALFNNVSSGNLSETELEGAFLATLQTLGSNAAANPVVWLLVLLASVFGLYINVNQSFLGFIALLDGRGPIGTIRHGMAVVNQQWWEVLALILVQVVILLLGFLACVVGLLAAAPVCVCINAAAYRQLFGTNDQAGFLS